MRKKIIHNLEARFIGLLVLISGGLYVYWLSNTIQKDPDLLSVVFIVFSVISVISSLILIINNWDWEIPFARKLPYGNEPKVGIIIPTWNEDPQMVQRTFESIFIQDYPYEKLYIIISDDAKSEAMREMAIRMTLKYPGFHIYYNIPPDKNSPFRKGESKAGNLNSALDLLQRIDVEIKYVETRDADDLVVDPYFLRHTIGQMEANERIAYVQTIKEVIHSKKDPFGNMEKLFYNSLMLSKNAANAVFPCGSGLVWKKYALLDIGGFPGWNLVEDFQSGAEALKRKWKSMFLPIVGAMGQIAPEDIPNLFKQRGTWALDSFRLLFWWDKRGLTFRQKLHFAESGLFYIMSILFFIQGLIPVIKLIWGIDPIGGDEVGYFVHITPYVLSVYLFIFSLVRYRPITFREIYRSFQIAFGLAPIYFKALLMAFFNGKNKKPRYVVTRKNHKYGMYILKVIPQLVFFLIILGSIIYEFYSSDSILKVDIITVGWALFYLVILSQIIKNSWFGVFSKH